MSMSTLVRAALVPAFTLLLATQAPGQSSAPTKFTGMISDYTDTTNANGAWHLSGPWSAHIEGRSSRGSFAGGLSMLRAGTGASPHTHHVSIEDGVVTQLANGWSISGEATITSNGTAAAFSGAPVTVELTGGTDVSPSNVRIVFGGAAAGHFGADPIDGVVTSRQ